MNTPPRDESGRQVLVVLDDTAEGATLLECSAALARLLRRELALVYVESTVALVAASLPFTQVLAHAGAQWQPLAPQDVERGYRAQAERLRALAGPIGSRHEVPWSLRTVRGAMPQAAFELFDQADLLFLGALLREPRVELVAVPRKPQPAAVLVLSTEDAEANARCLDVARPLAHALGAPLQVLPMRAGRDAGPQLAGAADRVALLVLPRALSARLKELRWPGPTLWVA